MSKTQKYCRFQHKLKSSQKKNVKKLKMIFEKQRVEFNEIAFFNGLNVAGHG